MSSSRPLPPVRLGLDPTGMDPYVGALVELHQDLIAGRRPTTLTVDDELIEIQYTADEGRYEYAVIKCWFPSCILAEVDGGTFGTFRGFRIEVPEDGEGCPYCGQFCEGGCDEAQAGGFPPLGS
jgi:hypothetical protein